MLNGKSLSLNSHVHPTGLFRPLSVDLPALPAMLRPPLEGSDRPLSPGQYGMDALKGHSEPRIFIPAKFTLCLSDRLKFARIYASTDRADSRARRIRSGNPTP